MCAFIARTSSVGITGLTGPNYAIWTMRENLETQCKKEAYSELVNGAAVWIICAGQWVFNEIVQYPPILDGWFEKAWSNGPLYAGPIVGIKRWKFWKKGFLAAEQSASANDECKKNARKAYDLMNVIERSCMF